MITFAFYKGSTIVYGSNKDLRLFLCYLSSDCMTWCCNLQHICREVYWVMLLDVRYLKIYRVPNRFQDFLSDNEMRWYYCPIWYMTQNCSAVYKSFADFACMLFNVLGFRSDCINKCIFSGPVLKYCKLLRTTACILKFFLLT